MAYQVLAEDGLLLAAFFDVDGKTIVFHSGGDTEGAQNRDYAHGLTLLMQRFSEAGYRIRRAWVDSNRVQALAIDERLILDDRDAAASPSEKVSRMQSRMQAIGPDASSKSGHDHSTKRIRLELEVDIADEDILKVTRSLPSNRDFRSEERLPVSELEKVTPEHLFAAVQSLIDGRTDHGFGESTDYDLLLEDGSRLAPKAVFGWAASAALGFQVKPRHFVGGLDSPCFRILKDAGYRIVPKGEGADKAPEHEPSDPEWEEGTPKLRKHLRRERASGLREAKKAEFRRKHGGRLFCERCGVDPVAKYETADAVVCIEVHHARVQVAEMQDAHRTRLEDLQCLCANCHRLVHREMRKTWQATLT